MTGMTTSPPVRLGVVSFLNTVPLIDGLERLAEVELLCSVPSLLIDQLLADEVDVALCSSIDYVRSPDPLVIVPAGQLGSCGPTLTVRLYSKTPVEAVEQVHCDTDSHTSVALLRILLQEQYGVAPALIDYHAREHLSGHQSVDWPDAMLLIGDKVVTDSPPAVRYPHQLDLGEAWFQLTGLPFVFAAWMARQAADSAQLTMACAVLDRQRRYNALHMDRLLRERAPQHGWPVDLARDYLTKHLEFDFDERSRAALKLFFDKALEHGLVPAGRAIRFPDLAAAAC